MAPQPKRRHSHHRTGRRRSQIKLEAPTIITCPNCKAPTLPHQVCKSCGQYDGRQVL